MGQSLIFDWFLAAKNLNDHDMKNQKNKNVELRDLPKNSDHKIRKFNRETDPDQEENFMKSPHSKTKNLIKKMRK
jgi:hypothetical protein